MPATRQSSLPFSIKAIIVLLIVKAAFPIIGEILPHFVVADPAPFIVGTFSFLIPAVLLPTIIAIFLVRSPAAGFWAALAYAVLAALVSGLLILAQQMASPSGAGLQNADPIGGMRAFEYIWRMASIGTSLLLVLSLLRPSVFRWVNSREEELRMSRFPSRRTTTIATRAVWILPLITAVTLPTIVWFAAQRIVGHVGFADAMSDILIEHLKGRALMFDLFSVLPYAVLAVTAYKNARRMSPVTLWSVTIGGLLGIIALMTPMYYLGWETQYNATPGDDRTTGAMIFFFTPLYCIATMLAGMLLGWIAARLLRKGVDDLIDDHT